MQLSHYEVLEKIGEGGMGVVYRARDTRLGRTVAIKVLRPETVGDPERKWRFVREAKAASALNHPHIVTIHDIDSADGIDFIVMEWVAGASLDRWIANGPLPLGKALDYAIQAASALAAAHAAGIVHRDIKPANLIVTESGPLKVLDFGLAKLVEREEDDGVAPSASPTASLGDPRTRQGVILGTLSYMSPEQAEGKRVDARSDVFSLGVVLWEMLAGRRAFEGDSHLSILTAILRDQPLLLRKVRPDVPAPLEAIVARCLEKDPRHRYPSAAELQKDLLAVREGTTATPPRLEAALRRPAVAIPALLVLLALVGVAAWLAVRNRRVQWAREVAMPEIARLIEAEDFVPAARLARQAEHTIPGDPELRRLVTNATERVSVDTEPPGAQVSYASYMRPESGWERLGISPLNVLVPIGALRWKVERAGYETLETAPPGGQPRGDALIGFRFLLTPLGKSLPGMVRVPGGDFQYRFMPNAPLAEYWLDKYEVTNRQFKEFVDRGGYARPDLWRHPFVRDGREISRDEAMRSLRDATGRPGPATWELGTYPAGREDYPVSGVSWYEAAAYCESAGKSLPTLHHWYRAAEFTAFAQIVQLSNFGGEGPASIGTHRGLGPFGTYDMAGNVKEWCWNEARKGDRYLAGGAWSDPTYLAGEPALAASMQRSPEFGLRCSRYTAPLAAELTAPMEQKFRDYSKERPVSDEVFQIYAGLYAYERGDLGARVELVDDSAEHWRRETISFNSPYGERVLARLFLPRNSAPPYQTVVYFPDSSAEELRSSENLNTRWFDFLMRSGRAVMLPVYKATYERLGGEPMRASSARRDALIFWSKDLGRSIDYLQTRRDIDSNRLAFYGFSLGAVWGPVLTALEPRLKTSIWLGGGFPSRSLAPEADPLHFAPRIRMPVLMINGRQDFMRPIEISQTPLLRLLGTPEKDKRHAVLEGGHLPPRMQEVIREVLDWLDRYLGPVRLKA